VYINCIEISGITGGAQALVLRHEPNDAQNIVHNVGRCSHDANVLTGTVTDAPESSLSTGQTEQRSH
jgi:hypothetical protein